jgi:multidrug resistance efflux pump
MPKNKFTILLLMIAIALAAAACAQSPTPETGQGVDIPIVVDDFAVVAEGRLVPADTVRLAFVTGGRVAEILVEEGDTVQAGDVIARLGDREPFEAAVSGAELELSAAELEKTQAESDLLAAQQALDTIFENWPEQATLAQQALKDARERQRDADRNLGYLTTSADQTDIDLAFTSMVLAEDALEKAQDDFDPWENKPETNLTRAVLQQRLAAAQKAYDDAVRKYNALVDAANDFDVSQAEAELSIANAQLDQSQADYDELIDGPDPDQVSLAETRIAAAEARLRTAEQRILTATANLASAQSKLDNLELTATINGTVVDLTLIEGEQVTPGTPVVQLADFSEWYVETDNLTEIEVVDIALGQSVSIVPDALPDLILTGVVDDISDVFEEKRGDITYTTSILLDEIDPRLRWGMTVVVTFEE